MLACTVKFCGGCNPRHDLGDAYRRIRAELSDTAVFTLPEDGKAYDVLVILRGCTGCEYQYDTIDAKHHLVVNSAADIDKIIDQIRALRR